MMSGLIKKFVILVTLLVLVAGLAACSAINSVTGQASASGPSGTQQPRELPQGMKLALVTVKLDQSQHPITAEQAKALLPLWKALRTLSSSDTAAKQEVQAVLDQIQGTLTPEQAAELTNVSFQDFRDLGPKLGLNGPGGFGSQDPSMRATREAARQSGGGGFPGGPGGPGGPPPGGGGFPGGPGGGGSGAQSTGQARFSGQGNSTGVNPALLEAIIKFLEARAQ